MVRDDNGRVVVTGASIGALNAAALAQYDAAEQCTGGLGLLQAYWGSITSLKDVMDDGSRGYACLTVESALSMGRNFFYKVTRASPACSLVHFAVRWDQLTRIEPGSVRRRGHCAIRPQGIPTIEHVSTGLRSGRRIWAYGWWPPVWTRGSRSGSVSTMPTSWRAYSHRGRSRRRSSPTMPEGSGLSMVVSSTTLRSCRFACRSARNTRST